MELVADAGGGARAERLERAPCTCSVKSALVPAYDLEAWRGAMARSPFGPGGVSVRWPYLGGVVGARAAAG
eukprot:15463574-Alexandrium_andersonii.AAC.1